MKPTTATKTCPADAHRHLLGDSIQLIKHTTPGARTADPQHAGGWLELRICNACGEALPYWGSGESRRWLYAIVLNDEGKTTFCTTLDDVAEQLRELGRPVDSVGRYILGLYSSQGLTADEVTWLLEQVGGLRS
jgi:hypothetical protein